MSDDQTKLSPQDLLKKQTAESAIKFVEPDTFVGVGTGSTVNFFIDALARLDFSIKGAVSSSEASTQRMKGHGINVVDLNDITEDIPVYVDGADESDNNLALIKGGGGALTREKIVASACDKFICIADESKLVQTLGKFPLPVEVIPMARTTVAKELSKLGGKIEQRADFITDNGNIILDIIGLEITNPKELEDQINNIPGVVTNGLFAISPADVLLLGTKDGVREITA